MHNSLDELLSNGVSYHVWQAVYIAEQVTLTHPDRGESFFDQSGIRFRPYENYEFPPRDIRSVQCKQNEIIFILNFLGLYGINSPLPRCYHEQIPMQLRSLGENNVPLQSFYDIFNNRFYWLYYQSWKKYRFHLFINKTTDNNISSRIFSFCGKNPSQKKSELNDFILLKFSGIFSQKVRNKASLQIILSFLFPGYKISIREFISKWIELTDLPDLGRQECLLGINTYAGRSIPDYMGRIEIIVSEIDYESYKLFLPGGRDMMKIYELVNLFVNDGLEFDLKFKIKSSTISPLKLDSSFLQLGRTSWLGKPQLEIIEIDIPYEEIKSAA